jgi:hypothetical protein
MMVIGDEASAAKVVVCFFPMALAKTVDEDTIAIPKEGERPVTRAMTGIRDVCAAAVIIEISPERANNCLKWVAHVRVPAPVTEPDLTIGVVIVPPSFFDKRCRRAEQHDLNPSGRPVQAVHFQPHTAARAGQPEMVVLIIPPPLLAEIIWTGVLYEPPSRKENTTLEKTG